MTIGVVTIVVEQYVDIRLDLAQQLIELNLELIYLKRYVVDSTLIPSSILDLSKFYLLVSDLPRAVLSVHLLLGHAVVLGVHPMVVVLLAYLFQFV